MYLVKLYLNPIYTIAPWSGPYIMVASKSGPHGLDAPIMGFG